MNRRPQNATLWKITVATDAEHEELVAEMLQVVFGADPGSYTDAETHQTQVSVYLPEKPPWPEIQRELLSALAHSGLRIKPSAVRLARLPAQNWAESWKRHFRPLEIGRRLLIKPPWSRRRPKAGQAVVVLEPGLSFGTGNHPTTGFCLQALCAFCEPRRSQSFLDLGTGSGILAIAAARLGYGPILALDYDEQAVAVARANARKNRVETQIQFSRGDVARLPKRAQKKFMLICANLVSNLLIQERERIVARLNPGGSLVLAGILKSEFGAVDKAYRDLGLHLKRSRAKGEWRSGAWRFAPSGKNASNHFRKFEWKIPQKVV